MRSQHPGAASPDPLPAEVELAIEVAHRAGDLLREGVRGRRTISRKGWHDVGTDREVAAERLIMARLRHRFPDDARFGEETGRGGPDGAHRTWFVDPLDGTINYASGIPFWCVSVALAIGGAVVVGVIHDPLRAETVVATRGGGARIWPHGGALRIRRPARVADAVVSVDPGSESDAEAEVRIARLRSLVRAQRTLGSTALSLSYVALGRLDGVLQVRGLQVMDIAAAGLIVLEAGGRVTDADGRRWLEVGDPEHGRGVAAGGPAVHALLVASARAGQAGASSSK